MTHVQPLKRLVLSKVLTNGQKKIEASKPHDPHKGVAGLRQRGACQVSNRQEYQKKNVYIHFLEIKAINRYRI